MEPFGPFLNLLLLLLLLVTVFLLYHISKNLIPRTRIDLKSQLPPSPSSLPLIGHLHLLKGLPHKALEALSKQHGPIFFLKLGVVPAIVISSPDLAKEVLRTQDQIFASRPYTLAGEYLSYNFHDMALAPYGKHWKNMRKLCSTELFTTNRIDSFAWLRLEELHHMFAALLKSQAEGRRPVNVRKLLTTFNFNSITQTLISKRFFDFSNLYSGSNFFSSDRDADAAQEFVEFTSEATVQTLQFHVSEFVPAYLRWIDWTIPRAKWLHGKIDQFMQKLLDERKSDQQGRKFEDFLDVMEHYLGDDEPEKENIMKALILQLFGAGTDTSTTVIEWTLAELLQNPEALKKAQEELAQLVGCDRMVDESDFKRMEYLQAIIKEVFRLHPPVPLLVPHKNTQACNLAGYHIPKGATTFVNVYAIGRDPKVWEDPNEFKPERFLGKTIDVKGKDFELLPFGAGRRSCPGMMLGLKTVQLVLANLIHGFEWSHIPGISKEIKDAMEEVGGTVAWLKTPLEVICTPKFSPEVYARGILKLGN